jgi:TonB family protein
MAGKSQLLWAVIITAVLTFSMSVTARKAKKVKVQWSSFKPLMDFERASAHEKAGQPWQAIAEYQKALKEDPDEPYWHAALGEVLENEGDLRNAMEEYRIASEQSQLDSGLEEKYQHLSNALSEKVVESGATTASAPNGDKAAPAERRSHEEPIATLGPSGMDVKGVTAPIVFQHQEPSYSEKARRAKFSGTTVIQVLIDTQGRVQKMRVLKPLGLGLDEKALETIQNWRFKPAMKDGDPVPVKVLVEISFKLFYSGPS